MNYLYDMLGNFAFPPHSMSFKERRTLEDIFKGEQSRDNEIKVQESNNESLTIETKVEMHMSRAVKKYFRGRIISIC